MKGKKGPLVVLEYPGARWQDDREKVHLTTPGGPSQLLLSSNEGGEICRHVPAGWCADPYSKLMK